MGCGMGIEWDGVILAHLPGNNLLQSTVVLRQETMQYLDSMEK